MISTSTTATFTLPTELWRKIMRYATLDESSTANSINHVPHSSSDDLVFHTRMISNANLRTKVSLIHVCSKWRAIGTEFLWETISNQSQSHLVHIASVLSLPPPPSIHSVPNTISRSPPRGWWIRSIHTRFDFGDDIDTFSSSLDKILSHCPNLHTFMHVHDFNGPLPAGVIASLTKHCGSTLRRFQLDWGGLNTDDLTRLLEASPELQHVSVGCTFAPPTPLRALAHNTQPQYTPIAIPSTTSAFKFPSLRSVHFGNKEDGMTWRYNCHLIEASQWLMPSLTSVSIDIDARTCMDEVLGFLETHGKKLLTLSLTDSGRVEGLIPPLTWKRIFTLCPGLVELRISFNPFLLPNSSTATTTTTTMTAITTTPPPPPQAEEDSENEDAYAPFISNTPATNLKRLTFANWEFFPILNPFSDSSDSGSDPNTYEAKAEFRTEYLNLLSREFSPIGGDLTPLLRSLQFDFHSGRIDLPNDKSCREWWNRWLGVWSEKNVLIEGSHRETLSPLL